MFELPFEIDLILDRLETAGYEAYVVGGAVRDMIMRSPVHDYDITTSAPPDEIKRIFSDYKTVDTGIKHGTVTVIINSYAVEITVFRSESGYSDGRHPDSVSFSSDIRDDLKRRDFTMNAIAYSKARGLTDPFDGAQDIKNKIIRCVGEPDERFAEDHLRPLRALRFSSTLGFSIEENTESSIHNNRKYVATVSAERIFSELCKLLCGKNAKKVLHDYSDVIFMLIPELAMQKGCERAYGDGKSDLYDHTVNCLSYTEPLLHLRIAALLHDTVKPSDACNSADRHSIRDTVASNVLKRLHCSNALINTVCKIIMHQDVPVDPNNKVEIKRTASRIGIKTLKDVISLKRADVLSDDPKFYYTLNDLNAVYDTVCEIEDTGTALSVRDLAVNGNDVISLGVKPGKAVGDLLKYALDGVISDAVQNEKDALLSYIKKFYTQT